MSLENAKKLPNALIPKIDLEAWRSRSASSVDKQTILNQWYEAFRGPGLVYLTNHGLETLYHRVNREWRRFYNQPLEEKEKFSVASSELEGYNKVGKESVVLSNEDKKKNKTSIGDLVESIENSEDFGGTFPRMENGYVGGDALRDACLELYRALDGEVVRPCLNIATEVLEGSDLETRWFAAGEGRNNLRLARYVPRREVNQEEILYGEHTDYDGFTFLWRNRTNGLQAMIGDEWYDVPVLEEDPDALVINLGDLMEFWTGGAWHSPRHRVMRTASAVENTSELSDLVSIVYFACPNKDTKLFPLQSSRLPPSQDVGKIVSVGEYVEAKLAMTVL